MLHDWILVWFEWVREWGFWGVFVLMALESTIVPVPSELVIPPAAYWATQGQMGFWSVVLAGTLGSYTGSSLSYFFCRWAGAPLLERYGKYFFLPRRKVAIAHRWLEDFGAFGIFLARLLPVIRHLISMPAGIFKMNFTVFSAVTVAGAGFWCFILAWFGEKTIGQHPDLLESPAAMRKVIQAEFLHFVLAIAAIAVLYIAYILLKTRKNSKLG